MSKPLFVILLWYQYSVNGVHKLVLYCVLFVLFLVASLDCAAWVLYCGFVVYLQLVG